MKIEILLYKFHFLFFFQKSKIRNQKLEIRFLIKKKEKLIHIYFIQLSLSSHNIETKMKVGKLQLCYKIKQHKPLISCTISFLMTMFLLLYEVTFSGLLRFRRCYFFREVSNTTEQLIFNMSSFDTAAPFSVQVSLQSGYFLEAATFYFSRAYANLERNFYRAPTSQNRKFLSEASFPGQLLFWRTTLFKIKRYFFKLGTFIQHHTVQTATF